jgi:catechol 2,3-dioxygenase-like lactoylglutathione lyase family enzyme
MRARGRCEPGTARGPVAVPSFEIGKPVKLCLNPARPFARFVMTTLELNHVALYVTDVKRSSAFYKDVLKLQPLPRPAFTFPGAWFRLGTAQELHLIADNGAGFFTSHPSNHFALRVDDLDEWEGHLKSTGAAFAARNQRPDGASQLFLRDPDGHVIELFTPPV